MSAQDNFIKYRDNYLKAKLSSCHPIFFILLGRCDCFGAVLTAMYCPSSLYRRSVAGSLPDSLRLEAVTCRAPILENELLIVQVWVS